MSADQRGDRQTARAARVERLRLALDKAELSSLVVFGAKNIRYLTGFTGSAGTVVVRKDSVVLLSDFRYRLQAAQESPDATFVEIEKTVSAELAPLLADAGPAGIESSHLIVEQWQRLQAGLESIETRLVGGIVEELRLVKGPEEVRAIREAARLAVLVEERLQHMKVVGRAERDVALDLETFVRREGSERVPFPFIVASGPRGAMPHAEASAAVIEPGRLLVVDLGATVEGYASDMTRTFATGPLGREEEEIFALVRAAQDAARVAARPGMSCGALDGVARSLIAEHGREELFKHSLGHGVGLDVHEGPRVSSSSTEVLEPGMVITIEPGLYVPDLGGVRIEDTVLVTEEGIEVLTESPRDLVALT